MTTYYMVNDLDLCVSEHVGELVERATLIRTEGADVQVDGPLFTDRALADAWLEALACAQLRAARRRAREAHDQYREALDGLWALQAHCRSLGALSEVGQGGGA